VPERRAAKGRKEAAEDSQSDVGTNGGPVPLHAGHSPFPLRLAVKERKRKRKTKRENSFGNFFLKFRSFLLRNK
jgi:hypothetical protein